MAWLPSSTTARMVSPVCQLFVHCETRITSVPLQPTSRFGRMASRRSSSKPCYPHYIFHPSFAPGLCSAFSFISVSYQQRAAGQQCIPASHHVLVARLDLENAHQFSLSRRLSVKDRQASHYAFGKHSNSRIVQIITIRIKEIRAHHGAQVQPQSAAAGSHF